MNNWNPFSAKGLLSQGAFIVTLAAIAVVEIGFGLVIDSPLHAARLILDQKQIAILYASWGLVAMFGFFFVANTFVKRWTTILVTLPCGARAILRFFLLSPLLSIWLTIYTLMYSRDGVMLREGEKRGKALLLALATFIIFHAAFLGYSIVNGSINPRFQLLREVTARTSLHEGSHAQESEWLPGTAFMVHVYPYASPLTKVLLSLYTDFTRAHAFSAAPECTTVPPYLGSDVPNCYMTLYRDVASRRAFVTPAFGLLFESQYRQSQMSVKPTSAIQAFAMSAIAVDNLLTLIEPGPMLYDRREFWNPIGFLRAFGSPELPAIAAGQDLQRMALSSKVLGLLRGQLRELSKVAARLDPADQQIAAREVDALNARLSALEADPLAMHSAAPRH